MSSKLREYLLERYFIKGDILPEKKGKDFPIQIDDQDDDDTLSEFCAIFVVIKKNDAFEIELFGQIPWSREICDLTEIYGGFVKTDEQYPYEQSKGELSDRVQGRIVLNLHVQQIEALIDLAKKIRKIAVSDNSSYDQKWLRIMARTMSSLHRFVRYIKEYIATCL